MTFLKKTGVILRSPAILDTAFYYPVYPEEGPGEDQHLLLPPPGHLLHRHLRHPKEDHLYT